MLRLFAGLMVGLCLVLPAHAADPVFAKGGSVGLVPPAGMTPSEAMQGFEDRGARASILIAEMPPQAYPEVRTSFSDDAALAAKGVTIETRRDVELAGGVKGMLLSGYQSVGPAAIRKWILLAAGESVTALVTAQLPDEAAARYPSAAIEQSLLSVAFRPPPTTDEMLARLPFRVAALEGYRVVKVFGGSTVLLTKGPNDVIEGTDQPYFIAAYGMGDIRDDDRPSFARRAVASVPGVRELKLERGGPLRIAGQPGFEIIAKGEETRTGKPVKVAQWISFGRASYVRMIGVAAAEGFDTDFTALRALRDGVEPR
jgi:hypothetical protein